VTRGETAGLSNGKWYGTSPAIKGGTVWNIFSTVFECGSGGRKDGSTVGSLPDADGGGVLGTCESNLLEDNECESREGK
jgi:hypothetical protein